MTFNSEQILSLVVIFLAIVVAVLLVSRLGRQRSAAVLPLSGQDQGALKLEVEELRQDVVLLQKELERVRQSLAKMNPEQSQSNYHQAIEMARQGHSVSEVAGRCGISRSEAELIVAMHRENKGG